MAIPNIPKPVWKILKISLLVAVIILALAVSYFRVLDNYELELLDIRFRSRPYRDGMPEVALIEVGDDTLEKLGKWPIGREYHAALIKALTQAGARMIVFDVFFPEPGDSDDVLEAAMRESGRVYLPYVLNISPKAEGGIRTAAGYTAKNIPRFEAACRGSGNIAIVPDIDGKYRRVPLLAEYDNRIHPFLSFLVACDYLGIPQSRIRISPGKHISMAGEFKIPIDENSNLFVNYSAPWGSAFRHFSYIDILQSSFADRTGQEPILDLSVLKDKICIVGSTATGTVDLRPTPLERIYPAVGIHAEVINAINRRSFIRRLSRAGNLALLLILSILIAFITLKMRPFKGALILAGILCLFIASAFIAFIAFGLWVDLFYPLILLPSLYLILTFRKYIIEYQQRQILEKELEIARTIQESFLPKTLPQVEGLEIAARMTAHHHVGGDLYDCVDLGEGKIGILLGDVSGKGVPAALFMAKVISEFKMLVLGEKAPGKLLFKLNQQLVEGSSSGLFVTGAYLVVDTKEGIAYYSSAGHMPPVMTKGSDGSLKLLTSEAGMPLGLFEGDYSENSVKFENGDTIVLYSDGVSEAMDLNNNMYTEERLQKLVEENSRLGTEELLNVIRHDVKRFEGKAGAHDDTTVMIIRGKEKTEKKAEEKEKGASDDTGK
ncbi:CHASE2 domain-containing protein [Candidatus Omnitrophota bacterium]